MLGMKVKNLYSIGFLAFRISRLRSNFQFYPSLLPALYNANFLKINFNLSLLNNDNSEKKTVMKNEKKMIIFFKPKSAKTENQNNNSATAVIEKKGKHFFY